MCGIFSLLNNDNLFSKEFIKTQFEKGKSRGPENSMLVDNVQSTFGFHRLAINGLNQQSNQPIILNDDILLICNGEIYNYKELYQLINVTPTTQSDCEIIIHLYRLYGIEETLNMLDGVFAFVLLDYRINNNDLTCKCYVARDPFGIRPLFILKSQNSSKKIIGLASEMKVLNEFYQKLGNEYTLEPFSPGTYSFFSLSDKVLSKWTLEKKNTTFIPYFIPAFPKTLIANNPSNEFMYKVMDSIRYTLRNAVVKRCTTTERPVAALLSGGLDSSLIAALVSKYYVETLGYNKLETYSIGLEGSVDLKYAKIVADYIGSCHTEIIVTEMEMCDAIPEVIFNIESYDTTTVRASIGNYLLGKYIAKHSSAKVIFNGDGSDEVCGGYLYMKKCPDAIEFDKECRRLLKDIHLFDVLRSDRCISCHGLEPRTPFLDKEFVNNYLSIPAIVRSNDFFKGKGINIMEKYLLRASFSSLACNLQEKQILPDDILWRKKEAFSDGVSGSQQSFFQIIQNYINNMVYYNNFSEDVSLLDKEKFYYKSLFQQFYPDLQTVIPYYWMPKYLEAIDPSARTLEIYS